jgi:CheY-like chemotaxis protein
LLAEDNESIRRFMAYRLRQSGAEVAVAADGREAVDLVLAAREAGRPFDWVLMDVQMPVLDGYEATRQIRERGYRGPVIALTAYPAGDSPDDHPAFGCDAHIGKPVDWDQLVEVLNAHRGKPHGPGETTPPASGARDHGV